MGYIYRITNLVNNKSYIGETKQLDVTSRWNNHIKSITTLRGATALIGAFKKHGLQNFKFEVIIICFDEDRLSYEVDYIKKYDTLVPNGYNIANGRVQTKDFNRANLKEFLKEKKDHAKLIKTKVNSLSVSIKEKMEKSEKWQKALRDGRVGSKHKHSDETKNKISNSVKRYYADQMSEETRTYNIEKHRNAMIKATGKPIEQYSMNDEFIKRFDSISLAVRETGIIKNSIQQCLYGRYKQGGGFKWKFTSQ